MDVRVCVLDCGQTHLDYTLISGELKRVEVFSVPVESNVADMSLTSIIPLGFLTGNAAKLYFGKCHISVWLAARQDEQVKDTWDKS